MPIDGVGLLVCVGGMVAKNFAKILLDKERTFYYHKTSKEIPVYLFIIFYFIKLLLFMSLYNSLKL